MEQIWNMEKNMELLKTWNMELHKTWNRRADQAIKVSFCPTVLYIKPAAWWFFAMPASSKKNQLTLFIYCQFVPINQCKPRRNRWYWWESILPSLDHKPATLFMSYCCLIRKEEKTETYISWVPCSMFHVSCSMFHVSCSMFHYSWKCAHRDYIFNCITCIFKSFIPG